MAILKSVSIAEFVSSALSINLSPLITHISQESVVDPLDISKKMYPFTSDVT